MQKKTCKKTIYKPAVIGFSLILVSILVAISAALGSRISWWDYDFAVIILKWAAYAGVFAALLCLSGFIMARPGGKRRGFIYSLLGLVIAIPMIFFYNHGKRLSKYHPPFRILQQIQKVLLRSGMPLIHGCMVVSKQILFKKNFTRR